MWNTIVKFLGFTGVTDVTVWQDIIISAFIIPISSFFGYKIFIWWNNKRPSRLIFKHCLKQDEKVYIFHSQMSGANDDWSINTNQKYITRFPAPTPTDHAKLEVQLKLNIDPVISEAEVEGLADIYNILGSVGKLSNIKIGHLINDWNIWSESIFSIGFNPKSNKLIEKCSPVYFELNGSVLKIKNQDISYNSNLPNDAGIIQKTFTTVSHKPVFIFAGLGTTGTSAAAYIFKQNFVLMGRLFGNRPFCIFLKAKIDEGKTSAYIDKIYPAPKWYRIIQFPFTYYR